MNLFSMSSRMSLNHCARAIAMAATALAAAGCNSMAGQPQIKTAAIEPSAVLIGSSAVISVAVKDKHHTVTKIEGAVKEDPRLKFRLKDDGKDPDAKAGDGVWSLRVDVPPTAPPGQFTVDLTAYNADGQPVLVRPKGGGAGPLTQSLTVTIEAAAQQ